MRTKMTLTVFTLVSISLTSCSNSPVVEEQVPTTSSTPGATSTTISVSESNIYEICVKKILDGGQLADGDPARVRFAPQSESTILTRGDGLVAVYIDAEDGNNASMPEAGVVCIASGGVANPDWYRFGVGPVYSTPAEIEHTLQLEVVG